MAMVRKHKFDATLAKLERAMMTHARALGPDTRHGTNTDHIRSSHQHV